ncbi:MAG: sigma-70 factor domain-containing protein, partial [Actinomycetes bacterium]
MSAARKTATKPAKKAAAKKAPAKTAVKKPAVKAKSTTASKTKTSAKNVSAKADPKTTAKKATTTTKTAAKPAAKKTTTKSAAKPVKKAPATKAPAKTEPTKAATKKATEKATPPKKGEGPVTEPTATVEIPVADDGLPVSDEEIAEELAKEPEEQGFVISHRDESDEPVQQVTVAGATADPVKDYLKQIGKVALLNAEQEVELAKRIEAGLFAEEKLNAGKKLSAKLTRELEWIAEDGRRAKDHLLEA